MSETTGEHLSTTSDILKVISDNRTLAILKTIAQKQEEGDASHIRSTKKLNLTRTDYFRISKLIDVHLVIRKNRRYLLTTFGKAVYDAQNIVEAALNDHWKLRAVDSVEMHLATDKISTKDLGKIINSLIDNRTIKEILLTKSFSGLR
jgi:predicted transcriptional regulator